VAALLSFFFIGSSRTANWAAQITAAISTMLKISSAANAVAVPFLILLMRS
jgi:hypothetical protein